VTPTSYCRSGRFPPHRSGVHFPSWRLVARAPLLLQSHLSLSSCCFWFLFFLLRKPNLRGTLNSTALPLPPKIFFLFRVPPSSFWTIIPCWFCLKEQKECAPARATRQRLISFSPHDLSSGQQAPLALRGTPSFELCLCLKYISQASTRSTLRNLSLTAAFLSPWSPRRQASSFCFFPGFPLLRIFFPFQVPWKRGVLTFSHPISPPPFPEVTF